MTSRWQFIPSHLSSFACLHHFLSLNRKATCPHTSYLPSSSTVLRTVCPFECLLKASLQYLRSPPPSRRMWHRNPSKSRTVRLSSRLSWFSLPNRPTFSPSTTSVHLPRLRSACQQRTGTPHSLPR